MKTSSAKWFGFATLLLSSTAYAQSGGPMILESLTGPVTPKEIAAFKSNIAGTNAPERGDKNIWVYGNAGKMVEACGLMYEVTSDTEIMNRMIYFCDAALAGRNDLAPANESGQRIVWTGKIEPVWPPSKDDVVPAGAGIEQGSVLAHMLYCSKLILQTPALWDKTVSIGDPKNYGATYKERALTYIKQADYVVTNWLSRFVRKNDLKLYFPGAPNTYKPNDPAPWNQLFMVTNGLVRLTQCHVLLNDAPDKVKLYDDIVKANLKWFMGNLKPNRSGAGTPCYIWKYAINGSIEDTNHAAYDSEGLWLIYNSGRYNFTLDDMKPFANTYFDVVLATTRNGVFAGRVDGSTGTGHAGGDNYVRDEYLYLADILKDKYNQLANIELQSNKVARSPQIAARLLWLKNKRFLNKD